MRLCYESPEIPRWTVPLPHRVLGLLIGGCFLLFGLTGNILFVTSYIKNKHVQTPFNTIVLSMSCNDLVWITFKHVQTPFNTIVLSMSCNDLVWITFIFTVLLSVYGSDEWLPIYTTSGDVDVLCAYMNIIHTQCEISSFLHVLVQICSCSSPFRKTGKNQSISCVGFTNGFHGVRICCACLEHTACTCVYSPRQIVWYRTEIHSRVWYTSHVLLHTMY